MTEGADVIDNAEFAKRMRAARAYLDLTLDQAGDHLDYSPSHLSKMEHGDENGHQFRKRDRQAIAAVYCGLTGWPPEFFTADEIPALRSEPVDDLEPADVVDLVERDRDGDGESAERG